MAKTSIDGLRVRSAEPRRRVVNTSSPQKVVGGIKVSPKSRKATPAKPKTEVKTTKPQRSAEEDFLSPLKGFEYNQIEDDLGAVDEAAWTELLSDFNDDKRPDDLGLQRPHAAQNDETEKPEKRQRKPAKSKAEKKLRKKSRRIKHPILLTIVVLITALGVTGFVWGDSLISRITNGNSGLWDAIGAMVSSEVPFETDANGRTNVLVFGTEGYDMNGTADGGGTHDGAQLTDSIMVISFDQKTQDVALLSLPRDLKVSMACSAGKVNEVYWCHNQNGDNDEAGARALMQQLGQILGVDFQYWAHVNWGSLVDIVDTIGGITVTLDEDINDKYYTGVIIQAGVPTRLTGIQAVALARARHGTTGGDFTRGNSQQKIVEGIVQELVNNGINLSEAFGLVNILGDNLRSSFSTDNIKAGVRLISSFNPSTIRNVPLVDYENNLYYVTTAMINGISYVVPSAGESNYREIQKYVAKMFNSNPAAREGAVVAVYNAAGENGLAGAERTQLENDGYTVANIGDAEVGSCGEKYCLYGVPGSKPATQTALEQRYGAATQDLANLPAGLAAGNADFVIVIGKAE